MLHQPVNAVLHLSGKMRQSNSPKEKQKLAGRPSKTQSFTQVHPLMNSEVSDLVQPCAALASCAEAQ